MRVKTTVGLLCFVLLLLSIGLLDVQASSCTDYYTAYQSAVDAYNSALNKLQRINVAVIKATPYASVPPEWKHLENEYDSDPTGFHKTLEGMGVSLPGYVSGPLSLIQGLELRQAKIEATTAYDVALTALETNRTALENCTGVTIVAIWCERGADCKTPPGVQGLPKAHYNFKCPNSIRVGAKLPLLSKACPGTWWSCEGVGQCPNRWSHLSDEEVAESQQVCPECGEPH